MYRYVSYRILYIFYTNVSLNPMLITQNSSGCCRRYYCDHFNILTYKEYLVGYKTIFVFQRQKSNEKLRICLYYSTVRVQFTQPFGLLKFLQIQYRTFSIHYMKWVQSIRSSAKCYLDQSDPTLENLLPVAIPDSGLQISFAE